MRAVEDNQFVLFAFVSVALLSTRKFNLVYLLYGRCQPTATKMCQMLKGGACSCDW